MKLTYFQLEAHLSRKLAPVYIISGDEPFLKHDALSQIRKAARRHSFNERTRLILQAGFDPQQLFTVLHTTSFFSTKRLVEMDCQETLPNKDTARLLEEYAAKPDPDIIIVFIMNKVDAKTAKASWFKAHTELGIHLAIWPPSSEQLAQWIRQRASKYKLSLSPPVLQLLCEQVAGNLTAAASTLEKLYLLRTEGPINEEHIRTVMEDESRFSLFELIDYLLAKDSKNVLRVLAHLKAEGSEPTLILWAITRELRLLVTYIEEARQSASIENILQKHRVLPRRQGLISRFIKHLNRDQCLLWLAKASHIDCLLKGSIKGNVWQALELFCLQITTT